MPCKPVSYLQYDFADGPKPVNLYYYVIKQADCNRTNLFVFININTLLVCDEIELGIIYRGMMDKDPTEVILDQQRQQYPLPVAVANKIKELELVYVK